MKPQKDGKACPRGRCLSCLSSVSCSFPSQLLCSLSGSKRVPFLFRLTASGDLPFLTRPGTPGSMSGCLPHPLVTKLRNAPSRPALPCSRCCLSNSTAYLSNCFGLNTANVWSLLKPAIPTSLYICCCYSHICALTFCCRKTFWAQEELTLVHLNHRTVSSPILTSKKD